MVLWWFWWRLVDLEGVHDHRLGTEMLGNRALPFSNGDLERAEVLKPDKPAHQKSHTQR
jgi:hypothetical protein